MVTLCACKFLLSSPFSWRIYPQFLNKIFFIFQRVNMPLHKMFNIRINDGLSWIYFDELIKKIHDELIVQGKPLARYRIRHNIKCTIKENDICEIEGESFISVIALIRYVFFHMYKFKFCEGLAKEITYKVCQDTAERHTSSSQSAPGRHASPSQSAPERHASPSQSSPGRHASPSQSAPERHASPSQSATERHTSPSQSAPERHTSPSQSAPERHTRQKHRETLPEGSKENPLTVYDLYIMVYGRLIAMSPIHNNIVDEILLGFIDDLPDRPYVCHKRYFDKSPPPPPPDKIEII